MKSMKFLVALSALLFSSFIFALNDDQEMEFTGAVNVGDIKTVKMYVETMNVNLGRFLFCMDATFNGSSKKSARST